MGADSSAQNTPTPQNSSAQAKKFCILMKKALLGICSWCLQSCYCMQ